MGTESHVKISFTHTPPLGFHCLSHSPDQDTSVLPKLILGFVTSCQWHQVLLKFLPRGRHKWCLCPHINPMTNQDIISPKFTLGSLQSKVHSGLPYRAMDEGYGQEQGCPWGRRSAPSRYVVVWTTMVPIARLFEYLDVGAHKTIQ